MISNLLLSDRLSMPYSKLDLKNISIKQIIEKVMLMFQDYKNIININNKAGDAIILIDETKFILAIRNLLDNAIKYNINKKHIDFFIIKNNNIIEFKIQDYGIGICKEDMEKIANPFYQVKQNLSTKGFGLGLTITKKIIESHKGKLLIQSKQNEGSIFTLHI